MKTIDFKYYMNLQARYISQISKKLDISIVDAAFLYSSILRAKLHGKYIIRYNHTLSSFE
ncbi:MAG: hypothetical protein JEY94_15435 [Melioribacteraceae bacterium]|nr:hypothetical protein [Melioribacteraceae bacterium]